MSNTIGTTEPKKIYIRVDYEWQPGADTVAYYPFSSDRNDYSGHNYNPTNTGNTQIGNYYGVNCMNFNSSLCTVSGIDSLTGYSNYSIIFYGYKTGWLSVSYNYIGSWGGCGPSLRSGSNNSEVRYGNPTNQYSNFSNSSPASNTWFMFAFVVLNGEAAIYINGQKSVLKSSGVLAPINNGNILYIGGTADGGNPSSGYISELIIEKKGWTAQEISDYYNGTKSLYGIS